jgi:hypothetical protein
LPVVVPVSTKLNGLCANVVIVGHGAVTHKLVQQLVSKTTPLVGPVICKRPVEQFSDTVNVVLLLTKVPMYIPLENVRVIGSNVPLNAPGPEIAVSVTDASRQMELNAILVVAPHVSDAVLEIVGYPAAFAV